MAASVEVRVRDLRRRGRKPLRTAESPEVSGTGHLQCPGPVGVYRLVFKGEADGAAFKS